MIKSLTITLEDSTQSIIDKGHALRDHRKNLTKVEALEYLETAKANIEQIDSSLETGYFRGEAYQDLKYAKHVCIEADMGLEVYIDRL